MSALRIHSLPHSICLKNVSVQKVKDFIQYVSFQTDLWICGTGGGVGRQCRKRWESARKIDFSAHSLALPGPRCVLYLNIFSGVVAMTQTVYTLYDTDPLTPRMMQPGHWPQWAKATSQRQQTWKQEVQQSSGCLRLIFLSASASLWDAEISVCYAPKQSPKELETFTKSY